MLRVRIELVPFGNERRVREIARAVIANVTPDSFSPRWDYSVHVQEGDNPPARTKAWEVRGEILGHDRRSSVWTLCEKAAHFAVLEAPKR